jgi:hypothetical protein
MKVPPTLDRKYCERMVSEGSALLIPPNTFEFNAWKGKTRITFRPDLEGLPVSKKDEHDQ